MSSHLRFVERASRKLSREVFHGMVVHGPKLQNKQGFLFRLVDVTMELFAMTTSVARAQAMADRNHADAAKAAELADLFCRMAKRRVKQLFRDLWSNDDVRKYRVAMNILAGRHTWLEDGVLHLASAEKQVPTVFPEADVALEEPLAAN